MKTLTEVLKNRPPLQFPPDVLAKLEAFRRGIAKEIADNINRAVLAKVPVS